MSRTIIDVHILQTVPPSNLNRDDTGSPKTAIYGGVRRARVSSQAWKRAVRLSFKDLLAKEELGERTKRVGDAIAALISEQAPDLADQAPSLAAGVLKAAGIVMKEPKSGAAAEPGYLLFLSHRQQENLAQVAVEAARAGTNPDGKLAKALANRDHSVDIAMFGRMVADASDINVDAAVQVAHAISVHAVDTEFDYFTAVDDRKHDAQQTGAGMIGTVEFNSSTLYRYATIDVDRLQDTLGNVEAARKAVEAFLTAFATSMPTGKQNTFANRTLPDAVMVRLRQTQPINLVGAFESPVRAREATGRIKEAADALAQHTQEVEQAYGQPPVEAWVTHVGERAQALATVGKSVTFPELVAAVGSQVAIRLGGSA
jgi:CRISPR system Cascade subunit CasC